MTMHFVQRSCSSLEDHISISSMMNHHFTLLGSGFECPKDQGLLLTIVSHLDGTREGLFLNNSNKVNWPPKRLNFLHGLKSGILAILPVIG